MPGNGGLKPTLRSWVYGIGLRNGMDELVGWALAHQLVAEPRPDDQPYSAAWLSGNGGLNPTLRAWVSGIGLRNGVDEIVGWALAHRLVAGRALRADPAVQYGYRATVG